MSLMAILIGIAFLNAPAWADDCSRPGSPGPDAQDAGAGAREAPATGACAATGGGPDRQAGVTITFPFGGGSDTSFRFQLPGNCLVLNASFQLDGRSALPPPAESKFTLSDSQHSEAYEGITKDSPPTGGPSTFQSQKFSAQSCSDVSSDDGNSHATITYGIGSPYHLFRFKVVMDSVTSLSVKWVGLGYDWFMDCTDTHLYIYNSGHWQSIGSHTADGIDSDYVTFQKTIQPTNGYIDSNGMVNILAMGPDGFIFSVLESDYMELKAMGSNYVWPSDVELDVGADGSAELQRSGQLKGQLTVGSDLLREPLQALLESAVPRNGSVEVPVRFSSKTGGVLVVQGTVDVDLPPVFAPIPAGKACFDEDTESPGLIDLDNYCKDDRDARPAYQLFELPEGGKIEGKLNSDGHHIDFRSPVKDWYGTGEFGIRATDTQGLSSDLFFNVTVLPVNDPPVLCPLPDQTAYEDQPFTFIARAFDVDDPASNLTFSDDCPLFDIATASGLISITPTNEQVGVYRVNLTVQDTHGTGDTRPFSLTVVNVNDPPVLSCADELRAVEHQSFEYQPSAADPDAGDVLTFSLESDIDGLESDSATGAVSFTPEEKDVGEHELVFAVTDLAGACDRRSALLTVKNVNDPPIIEEGGELQAIQDQDFEHQVNASDPDAGDRLSFSIDSDILRIDERTGVIRFTPGNEHVGRHRFTVTVEDAAGLAAHAQYLLVVQNINDPPGQVRISSPAGGAEVREGACIQFSGSAVDPDTGDVLVFVWREGGTVLGRGANLSVSLPPGRHLITLEVSDGLLNATVDVQLTVLRAESQSDGISAVLRSVSVPAGIILFVAAIGAAVAVRRRKRKNGAGGGAPPGPPQNPPPPTARPPALPPPPPAADPAQPQILGGSQCLMPQPPFYGGIAAPQPQENAGSRPVGYPYMPSPQAPPQQYEGPQYPPPNQWAGQPNPAAAYPPGWTVPAGWGAAPAPCQPGPVAPMQPPPAGPVPDGHSATYPQFPGPPAALSDPQGSRTGGGPGDKPLPPRRGPDEPESDSGAEPEREQPSGAGRGDGGTVSRDAMRAAVNDAKHAISAARAAGLNPSECERLLSEAVSASYRMDYARARRFARRSEAVALSLLERSTTENDRVYGNREDDRGGGEEAQVSGEY
jgi:hypothetical protein